MSDVPLPKNYFITLFPCHQQLDWSGPADILSMVPKTPHPNNDITVTLIAETLDPVNVAPVPPRGATWTFETPAELAPVKGKIPGSRINIKSVPDITFADALRQLKHKGTIEVDGKELTMDVILIPGGIGTRMTRIESDGSKTSNVASVVDFVREVCEQGFVRSAVLTVCTGSDLLAKTGLLDGRRATTNAIAFDKVAARNPKVNWLKNRRWVRSKVDESQNRKLDKEIWTSAGVSAGMDLMLHFLKEVYGQDFADAVERKLEYEWRRDVGEGEIDSYYA